MAGELRGLRDDPFGQLAELERLLRASRRDAAAGAAQSWTGLGFRIGDTWLVAPREDVREVIPPPATTRVPNAKPWMRGVANVRGELLAVVDLPGLLGLGETPQQRLQRVLVLNSRRVPVGLLVDEVAGYRQFSPGDQRPALVARSQPFTPYLLGAFARENRQWLAFSLHRLVQDEAFRSAAL
ncbi:chemotaxis protein CheW [Sinimarinibacterium thermocellulolyticum]|uniref:Chemotaxis protein CheW n=1 Tax=Sinimarinibacterium thermocellulolyticum TaxID=3170016 RepID=A0ABV2AC17_9GAMM